MSPNGTTYRPLVLVADDNADFLELLALSMTRADKFDFKTATTGREIIDLVNKECFDALVLDVKLPDIMGTTIAELIKEYDPDIKILFLTGYTGEGTQSAIENLGAKFWQKPVEDHNGLITEIYNLAMKSPCTDEERFQKRLDARIRMKSKKKLEIPSVLLAASRDVSI